MLLRRPADLQLRRQRRGVRRGARQADGEGPLEDRAPAAVRPGVFDAARDSRRRSRSARQRRRVPGGGVRSAIGQGDLAGRATRDGFSNVPRPVYGHGLVYIATGFQQPSLLAVRADGTGDVTKTHVAWTLAARRAATRRRRCSSATSSTSSATSASRRAWTRRRARRTGSSGWAATTRRRRYSPTGGSTSSAKKASRRSSRRARTSARLATNQLDGATLASMAVSGGSIFIRSNSHLYRIGK